MNKLHTDREYENELRDLRSRLAVMAYEVEQMIKKAVASLQNSDAKAAEEVILKDHEVNRHEVEMDALCLVILARRQPLGADLRFVTIALKMVTDLERIGDLAVSIANRTLKLKNMPLIQIPPSIGLMTKGVEQMLQLSIEAFLDADAVKAESVLEKDDQIDELYHQLFRALLKEMAQNENLIEPLVHIQSVAKWLERIGDHCTNLAELVVFMVRGENIRHMSKIK
ncbi:MAG: phosphate signaling complex protein PhoU [Myxococcaceae bacterium]